MQSHTTAKDTGKAREVDHSDEVPRAISGAKLIVALLLALIVLLGVLFLSGFFSLMAGSS